MRYDVWLVLSLRSMIFIGVVGDEPESRPLILTDSESIVGTLDFRDEDIIMRTEQGKWLKQQKEDCEVMGGEREMKCGRLTQDVLSQMGGFLVGEHRFAHHVIHVFSFFSCFWPLFNITRPH